jgi:hypothetical protein
MWVCRELGISDATYCNRRKQYGQVKGFKELQEEKGRVEQVGADRALDNSILKAGLLGNY